MSDYIKREDAINIVCDACNNMFPEEPCEPTDCDIYSVLKEYPEADVAEQKHGKWKAVSKDLIICTSCECGFLLPYHNCIEEAKEIYGWNYCPNCGARMDGE